MIRKRPDEPSPAAAEDQTPPGEGGASDDGASPGEGALAALPEAEVLLVELDEARGELEALKDRHLRLAAEFDNFRKRTAREREDLRTLAQIDVVRSVVPTLDDLARWRDIPNDATTVEALDKGLDLILKNLEKALADHGVARVEAEGARFDPEVHQAIMTAEAGTPDADDTIGRVFSNGYTMRGQLVRPAQVEVLHWPRTAGEPGAGEPDLESDGNGGAGPEDVAP